MRHCVNVSKLCSFVTSFTKFSIKDYNHFLKIALLSLLPKIYFTLLNFPYYLHGDRLSVQMLDVVKQTLNNLGVKPQRCELWWL